jgi:8-oxo-dGTP diphosphatase
MKLLKHIQDRPIPEGIKVWKREAARGVVFDEKGLLPMLFVSKMNYHKLPGGGIEKGESKIEACKREMLEETGCDIEVDREIGMITEIRSYSDYLDQTSYCYLGRIIKKGTSNLDQGEIDEGFELVWFTLDEAISAVRNDKPKNEEGKSIQNRDLTFLEEARKIRG